MRDPYDWLAPALKTIHKAHWHRQVQPISGSGTNTLTIGGQTLINFASNDYLGLTRHPRLVEAAIAAVRTYGTGSTGSRLLSGHRELHRQLERAIATLKGTDDAVVFSSGYLANVGTLAALMGRRDLILSDQYNHSSLRSGATLSGATVQDYRHCDLTDLRQQLTTHRHNHRRALIVTDSVFSMDGDLCPLPEILDLAAEFDCMVMVDEAHGTGVLGPTGAGAVEHLGCRGRPLIHMGTLSKALGSLGGYVAGSAELIDFLRNRAPTWIYTTGLSPADTGAAIAAIELLHQEPDRRDRLHHNVATLKHLLDQTFPADAPSPVRRLPSESPILCLEVKDAATVLALGQQLQTLGLFTAAVRPPTTPTSRLRLTVMATHEPQHLDQLVEELTTVLKAV